MQASTVSPLQLYMFYVGGNAGRSNIEVHDVQFAAVRRPEDAFPLLRDAWFGDKDKLHVDGFSIIDWADGHDVTLVRTPDPSGKHLYFVNLGGYRADTLIEQHEFGLFVAENAEAAKARAKQTMLRDADTPHKDNLSNVDDCLLLAQVGDYFIQLTENPDGKTPLPAWQGYQPIGSVRG